MDKLLYYGGVVLMIVGIMVIISAVPLLPLSVVSVGPITAEVSEFSATRIIIGVVLVALGFISYKKGK